MLTVIYDPKYGHAVRDGDLMQEWEHLKRSLGKGYDVDVNYATDNIIELLRVMVHWGLLPLDKFQLKFQQSEHVQIDISIDSYGNIKTWPNGFCDEGLIALHHLMGAKPTNAIEDMYYE